MVETITVVGMVISAMPIGEFDKRLVILTKELGKITAFVRGARKPTSPFLGGSQPMAFGEFTMYRGRNSYTITAIKVSDYFSNTIKDIDSMYTGMYFLEMADYYGREGIEAGDALKLLYLSMKALSKDMISNRLIRRIFELRMLTINGEYPNVFNCGNCNSKEQMDYFDLAHNTMLCCKCHGTVSKEWSVDPSTLYAMQFIITTPIAKLFSFDVKENVLEELERFVGGIVDKQIDKKFNSLEFLEISY